MRFTPIPVAHVAVVRTVTGKRTAKHTTIDTQRLVQAEQALVGNPFDAICGLCGPRARCRIHEKDRCNARGLCCPWARSCSTTCSTSQNMLKQGLPRQAAQASPQESQENPALRVTIVQGAQRRETVASSRPRPARGLESGAGQSSRRHLQSW